MSARLEDFLGGLTRNRKSLEGRSRETRINSRPTWTDKYLTGQLQLVIGQKDHNTEQIVKEQRSNRQTPGGLHYPGPRLGQRRQGE